MHRLLTVMVAVAGMSLLAMMPGTKAISMAAQHLDRQNLLVKFQSRDSFVRHAVKRDELGRHCPGVLEARGADALHLDAEA